MPRVISWLFTTRVRSSRQSIVVARSPTPRYAERQRPTHTVLPESCWTELATACPPALPDLALVASGYPTLSAQRSPSGAMLTFPELTAMAAYFKLVAILD